MNIVSTCIFFLTCTVLCTSAAPVIKNCRCQGRGNKAVKLSLVNNVVEYEPRPYCNMREVIAIMKSGSDRCLDPTRFNKKAVAYMLKELAKQSGQASSARTHTTTASISRSARALPAASASASTTAPM